MSRSYLRHYRDNLVIAIPVALSQLGHITVQLSDTIMAGKFLGEVALDGATLAGNVFFPLLVLGIGMSYGTTPLVAQADGAGDKEGSMQIIRHSLVLHLIAAVALTLLVYLSTFAIPFLDSPKEVTDVAIPFARIFGLSMIPIMIFQAFKQFAEGLSITIQASVISVSANVLNIILGIWFIHGGYGIEAMGVMGLAWATLIARVMMAVGMTIFFFTDKRFTYYVKNLFKENISALSLKYIFRMSIPVGVQLCAETTAFAAAFLMVSKLNNSIHAMAAHQIALIMAAVTYMGATGISASASVRVGNELGKGNYKDMLRAGLTNFHLVIVYMLGCALIFILFRNELPKFYIDSPDIIELASSLLLIAAFFQIADGIQAVGVGALRGLSDVKVPTLIALFSYWGIALPVAWLLGFPLGMGVQGIWYGMLIGLFVAATLLFWRFNSKAKQMAESAETMNSEDS
jgi:MATE family multidrug resistance protein